MNGRVRGRSMAGHSEAAEGPAPLFENYYGVVQRRRSSTGKVLRALHG